jgi:hypothetical protein
MPESLQLPTRRLRRTGEELKLREPRRKVMVNARMRIGASWNDVCILNISPRGLAMQAAEAPPRGTYLEIRRGEHEIMACVMWANDLRFGVRTQDMLVIDDIIYQSGRSAAPTAGAMVPERRRSLRSTDEGHSNSRMVSRAMEFAVIGIFAASAAAVTFGSVVQALQQPLADASAALNPKGKR